ncbi:MAG: prepilin-type N-terminal cleavage/methylation domain-containing protein [Deltaproteobacteria bacterium]|nr:prepilin-type N-terminal cleavage/methylation domain-containing protein [Deltaproteobacteria bacterium]
MMEGLKGHGKGPLGGNSGFTLIEMAIVLIIIGIIIGAVVKGKDLVRSAEQKRLYTTWIREWQVSFNNYYDRTGWILADDASDTNATRDGRCNEGATVGNIETQLRRVGLEPPPSGSTGSSLVRTYTDSQGIQRTLTIVFDYATNLGNFIRINGVPNDLGMALDRIIDGEMDGTTGDFLYTADGTVATPGVASWPPATTAPTANAAAILKLQF